MHHHNLPLDYPEFVRAKESAKNASDVCKLVAFLFAYTNAVKQLKTISLCS